MSTLRTVIWKACCFQMRKTAGKERSYDFKRARAACRAILHQNPDRVPAAFEAVGTVIRKLMEHYGFTEYDQLLEKFEIDVVPVGARYIGPELPVRKNERGNGDKVLLGL